MTGKSFTMPFYGRKWRKKKLIQEGLENGESPKTILNDGLVQEMDQVEANFKNGEIYIPEVLIAARAIHKK